MTEELFEKIVAYGFCAPSGMGGPGCVIMIAEDGRSYQFYGPELNNLNYYREWASLFPVLNQCDTRQWKLAENMRLRMFCDKERKKISEEIDSLRAYFINYENVLW